ncbi:MAG: FAD-binding protein [Saprospiraceae bacterium]|nr:FAD-binding protein [Saprospiraceae bacterium]
MEEVVEIRVSPTKAEDWDSIKRIAAKKSTLSEIQDFQLVKKSIDARSRPPKIQLRVKIATEKIPPLVRNTLPNILPVSGKQNAIIVGAGPAGYFAALKLLERGVKPIILDRGKDVRERRRDLRAIQQEGIVDPDSNYCFGEGGAGTYSDGKLYTRSHKRGNIIGVLQLLVEHGAKENILIDAHPHIGSNKLPKIISNIRESILNKGGEIHFGKRVSDFLFDAKGRIKGVFIGDTGEEFLADATILATGHSARDIYTLLEKHNVPIEFKPFALGVRVEHPQSLIDKLQYGQTKRSEFLPASSYKLTCQVEKRGVFRFCMCPGGLVVPAATAPGEIVVNGMSLSRRDSPFANSGMVTAIESEDLRSLRSESHFAGLAFQKQVEQAMFRSGDGSQQAPAQRMTDFVQGLESKDLPSSSYIPGLFSAPLHKLLPTFVYQRLKEGLIVFGKKMKGYYTQEANVIGTESRTSAPVRIPREPETCMSPGKPGLFPCGEGAGYAGGILSAAMDGQRVAEKVAEFLNVKSTK